MYNKGIDLRVCVNGRPVREYSHKGMQFIESRHGSNYTIKIKNDNANRVMAVVSVDGLDVISGKSAEKTDKGYIVDAYSSTEIKGYRLSDTERADFMFVSKDSKKNYVASSQEGDKRNSGVIGIRVFEEKPEKVKVVEKVKEIHHWHDNWIPKNPWNPYYPPYQPSPPYWYSITTSHNTGGVSYGAVNDPGPTFGGTSTSAYNCSTGNTNAGSSYYSAPEITGPQGNQGSKGTVGRQSRKLSASSFDAPIEQDSFDTGTGWGHKNTDIVKKEIFRKGRILGELVLYYATSEALSNMGIDLSDVPKIAEVPKAFGKSDYCQPPTDWNG